MKLQSRNFVEALIAVMAIWLIVREIPEFAISQFALPFVDAQFQNANWKANEITHFSVSLLMGVLLLVLRRRLGAWLVSDSDIDAPLATSLVAVSTALIGVYFVASGLATLVTFLVNLNYDREISMHYLGTGVGFLIAGVLVFAVSSNVTQLWAALRGKNSDAA